MAEERICPVCGRSNAVASRECDNCAHPLFSGRTILLSEEDETVSELERWRAGEETFKSSIPPPPQVRQAWEKREVERREAEQRKIEAKAEVQRLKAEREAAYRAVITPRVSTAGTASASTTAVRCTRCGAGANEAGWGVPFSFCANCGADLAAGTASEEGAQPSQTAVSSGPATKAKSYREQMVVRRSRQSGTAQTGGRRVAGNASVRARQQHSSRHVPAILSFFIPGGGQIMNGQVGKGVLLLLATAFALSMLHLSAWGLAMVVGRVLVAVDAYRIAEKRREGRTVREWEWDLQD